MRFSKTSVGFIFSVLCLCTPASADLITDVTPGGLSGFTGLNSSEDYLGVVVNSSPLQIDVGGTPTEIISLHTIVPQANDVIGRDQISIGRGNNFAGSRWSYELALPAVALAGTGLTDLVFTADLSFANAGYESRDRLVFDLFINGQSTPVVSTEVFGIDGGGLTSVNLTPAAPITALVTSAELRIGSGFFNSGNESFLVSNARFAANYVVPEASIFAPAALLAGSLCFRRRRSGDRTSTRA